MSIEVATVLAKLAAFGGEPIWDAAKKHSTPEREAIAAAEFHSQTYGTEKKALLELFLKWISSPEFEALFKNIDTSGIPDGIAAIPAFLTTTGLTEESIPGVAATELITLYFEHFCADLAACDAKFSQLQFSRRHEETQADLQSIKLSVADNARDTAEVLQMMRAAGGDIPKPDSIPIRDRDTADTRLKNEREYHSCVDTAKRHVAHGKVQLALDLMQTLKASLDSEQPSAYLLFRVSTMIGVCNLRLEQAGKAWQEFQNAKGYFPESAISWDNLANCAINLGRDDALTYSSKARRLKPGDAFATAVHILALSHQKDLKGLDDLLTNEAELFAEPLCLLAIAQHHYDAGNFERSLDFVQRSIEKDPYSRQAHYLMAAAIFRPLQARLSKRPPFDGIIVGEDLRLINQALDVIKETISLCEKDDFTADIARARSLRCAIYMAAGNYDQGLIDAKAVRDANPNDFIAKLHVVMAEWLLGQLTNADLEELAKSPDLVANSLPFLSHLYNKIGETARAAELMERAPDISPDDPMYGNRIYTMLENMRLMNRVDEAEWLVSDELSKHSDRPHIIHSIAMYRSNCGEFAQAVTLLRSIADHPNMQEWAKRDLARNLCLLGQKEGSRKRFAEACKVFKSYIRETKNSADFRNYIVALENSGDTASACTKAKLLRELVGRTIPSITDVEITYLERHGLAYQALELAERLLKEHPQYHQAHYFVQGIRLKYRLQ